MIAARLVLIVKDDLAHMGGRVGVHLYLVCSLLDKSMLLASLDMHRCLVVVISYS